MAFRIRFHIFPHLTRHLRGMVTVAESNTPTAFMAEAYHGESQVGPRKALFRPSIAMRVHEQIRRAVILQLGRTEVTREEALNLANHWMAAWNAHDLDAIMTHYEDAIELTSPVAAQLLGTPDGKVVGKA